MLDVLGADRNQVAVGTEEPDRVLKLSQGLLHPPARDLPSLRLLTNVMLGERCEGLEPLDTQEHLAPLLSLELLHALCGDAIGDQSRLWKAALLHPPPNCT